MFRGGGGRSGGSGRHGGSDHRGAPVDACSRTWWLSVQAYASMKPLTCHWAIECADQFPTL